MLLTGTPGISAPAAAKSVSQVTVVQSPVPNINNLVPIAPKHDFDVEVLQPLRAAQKAKAEADEAARVAAIAAEAERVAAIEAEQQRLLEQQRVVQVAQVSRYSSYGSFTGTLIGSIGYAFAGGNCVNQINPSVRPDGNPITWAVTTQTPYIGAAGLFPYNHVVRVTGLWSNGDVEVANENWNGVPVTRFPRSAFRGFR